MADRAYGGLLFRESLLCVRGLGFGVQSQLPNTGTLMFFVEGLRVLGF